MTPEIKRIERKAAKVYAEQLRSLKEIRGGVDVGDKKVIRELSPLQVVENARRELAYSRRMALSVLVDVKIPKTQRAERDSLYATTNLVAVAFAKADLDMIRLKEFLKRVREKRNEKSSGAGRR